MAERLARSRSAVRIFTLALRSLLFVTGGQTDRATFNPSKSCSHPIPWKKTVFHHVMGGHKTPIQPPKGVFPPHPLKYFSKGDSGPTTDL